MKKNGSGRLAGWIAAAAFVIASVQPVVLLAQQVTSNQFVTSSYVTLLNRNPDPNGWLYWVGIANSGQRAAVANGFLGSAEYGNKADPIGSGGACGATTGSFVDCIFEFGLGRVPSGSEPSNWAAAVNGGSRYSALESFYQLGEFQTRNSAALGYQTAYTTLTAVTPAGQSSAAGTA